MPCSVVYSIDLAKTKPQNNGNFIVAADAVYLDSGLQRNGKEPISVTRTPGMTQVQFQAALKTETVRHLKSIEPAFSGYGEPDFNLFAVWDVL